MASYDKLSQAEAERLINMLKRSAKDAIVFPQKGCLREFNVIGDTKKDIFIVNIYRGKINVSKCNFGGRLRNTGQMLLELHLNETGVHQNPDGTKVKGSHMHIYSEEHGRSVAIEFNLESENLVDNCIRFMERFNIIKMPNIIHQVEEQF